MANTPHLYPLLLHPLSSPAWEGKAVAVSKAAGHKVQPWALPCTAPALPTHTEALIGNDSWDEDEQGSGNTEALWSLLGPGEEEQGESGVKLDIRDVCR
jgi:hypothetical protein